VGPLKIIRLPSDRSPPGSYNMEFMKHGSVKSKEDTQSEQPPKITKAEELKKKGYIYKESKGGGTPRIDKLNINDAVF
jgi:hypothetical protein